MMAVAGFLVGPIGRWLLVAAAIGWAIHHIDSKGYERAKAECNTAALEARNAAQAIDLNAAQAAAEATAASLRQEQASVAANEEKIRDYERALSARPGGACLLRSLAR
jgi:hypothetical protein